MKDYLKLLPFFIIILTIFFEVNWAVRISSRTRRNTKLVKYIVENEDIYLQCFANATRPQNENDIESYEWKFSNGQKLSEDDIKYQDKMYRQGAFKGDIIILKPDISLTSAACYASMVQDEGKTIQNEYQFKLAKKPEKVVITSKGMEVGERFQAKTGKYPFECEAQGLDTLPNITFLLNGRTLKSNKTDKLSIEKNLKAEHNNKELICKVDHIAGNLETEVTLDVKFAPVLIYKTISGPKDEENGPAVIKFKYRSNPLPSFNWSYSNSLSCSVSEGLNNFKEHYSMTGPKISKDGGGDLMSSTISLSKITEEDKDRCFYLTLTNSEGTRVLHSTLSESGNSGGIQKTTMTLILVPLLMALMLD